MPKILVIEDEHTVRNNILELLNAEGFETLEAENGQVGVRLAQEQTPDLIICDIMMPQLDGFGVLQILHQNPSTAMIPLIFLTAKSDWDAFRQGMALGADDYLTKPFTSAELLDAIATRLTKHAAVVQLQQQVSQLRQDNLAKEEFVSTAAHELRGPLANIRMAIEMLRTSPDVSEQQFYLEILKTACDREADLINDLLDLQRLEAAVEPPIKEVLDLRYWVPALMEPFQVRAAERQQSIQVTVSSALPPLLTDDLALQRMLTELINNACKYTPPGSKILVSVAPGQSDTAQPETQASSTSIAPSFQVQVGNVAEIPAKSLPHIFDRFYRVPGSDRWHQGGSGLGLTLVKKLAERLGGTIQVSSEAGWTQFVITLPLIVEPDSDTD